MVLIGEHHSANCNMSHSSRCHLFHGAIIGLEKGDILGHEFMGLCEEVGSDVKDVKVGDRVVASFNIGCGKCFMCSQGLSSTCFYTNSSKLQNAMCELAISTRFLLNLATDGNRTCGMFGYSHFTGGGLNKHASGSF